MRAVTIWRFGGPDVLEVSSRPKPEPGPGEVRIRVAAAAVNPTDIGLRIGRQQHLLAGREPPFIPGVELAGTVDVVSDDTGWRAGDEVMAVIAARSPRGGAHADYVVAPARSVVRIPRGIEMVDAATVPMNGLTAWRALQLLDLPPGSTVLVSGAAGAVGGYTVELAHAHGLVVIADAQRKDMELVRSLGADTVVPRSTDLGVAMRAIIPEGVDAVVDAAKIGRAVMAAVRDGGTIAVVEPPWATERDISLHRVAVHDIILDTPALEELRAMVQRGQLTPRVAGVFRPEDVALTHERRAVGGLRGRDVLAFDPGLVVSATS